MSTGMVEQGDTGGAEIGVGHVPELELEASEPRRVRTTRYRYVPSLPGIEAVSVSGACTRWSELHEAFAVCTVERGPTVSYQCNSRTFMRSPRVGMLVGPGELHADGTTSVWSDYRLLRISPAALERARAGLGLPHATLSVAEHEIDSTATNALFLSLHLALERGNQVETIRRLADACLGEIMRRCTSEAPASIERWDIRRAREFIRRNLGEPLTLADIARAAGRGKWGFAALFREHVGVPPHKYVVTMRLAHARALLATGRLCGEVAVDVGFFDQSHLNRWFESAYGVTPGEYQRAVLESAECAEPGADTGGARLSAALRAQGSRDPARSRRTPRGQSSQRRAQERPSEARSKEAS
jgi:AraC-like DNA-binding protein